MWSWSDVVTPWDVKQYAYCPRIPWVAWQFGVREPETRSMILGREERLRRLARIQDIGLEPPVRFEVEMYSPKLRMAGVADAVAGQRRLTVVEVKAFKRRLLTHFKAQLTAYALLSEETLGPTHRAVLVMPGKLLAIEVTGDVLEQARRLVAGVRDVILSESPPRVEPGPKCISCWYRRLCTAT